MSFSFFWYFSGTMDQKIPYDDYQLPVVFLPSYENPPAWIPTQEVRQIMVESNFELKPKYDYDQ